MSELRKKLNFELDKKGNFELDCYIRILASLQNKGDNLDSIKICLYRYLIKFMSELKYTGNKTLVRNKLIILISLLKNIPPDIYHTRGINSNKLSKDERENYVIILKSELITN